MAPKGNRKDKTEPTLILEELRASERNYRLLIEANDFGYVILSTNGTVLDANQRFVAFTGHRNLKEILGRNSCDWVAPQQKETFLRTIERCLSEGCVQECNIRYVGTKGTVTALTINAAVDRLEGTTRLLVLCRKETTHKQDEELRQRRKAFTNAIFASAPLLIYECDDQLRLLGWNRNTELITGYSAKELSGKNLFDWFGEPDIPLIRHAIQSARLSGFAGVEIALTLRNGTRVPYHFIMTRTIVDEREFFTGLGIDHAALKGSKQDSGGTETQLRMLVESAPVSIGMGRRGELVYANSKYLSMMGYTSIEQIKGISILEQFAPQCRKQVRDGIQRREKGLPAPSEYESIFQRIDGSQFPVHISVSFVQFVSGPVSLAFVTDISARKLAEEQQRRTNELLVIERSTLHETNVRYEATLNALPDLLFELDSERRIVDFHASNPQMLYVSPSQFIGKPMHGILPADAEEIVSAAIAEAEQMGQHHGASYSLNMPDGIRWFELSIARKGTAQSPLRSFIMLVRDVTDRKTAQEELRSANAQLQAERESLNDKNIVLKELLNQLGNARAEVSHNIQLNLQRIVLPLLNNMEDNSTDSEKLYVRLLRTSIEDILSPYYADLLAIHPNLTPHETDLCNLVRNGLSTKEIAIMRNRSVLTIQKQRKTIRKKLGLTDDKSSLRGYLLSMNGKTI